MQASVTSTSAVEPRGKRHVGRITQNILCIHSNTAQASSELFLLSRSSTLSLTKETYTNLKKCFDVCVTVLRDFGLVSAALAARPKKQGARDYVYLFVGRTSPCDTNTQTERDAV